MAFHLLHSIADTRRYFFLKIKLLSLAVLSASLLSAVHAKAATMDLFTLTYNSNTFSFTLPDSPTPTSTGNDCIDVAGSNADFCINPVAVTINSSHYSTDSVEFFTSSAFGGLEIFNGSQHSIVSLDSSQLFSGMVSTPNFTLGTYDVTRHNDGNCGQDCNQSGRLVISQVSTSPVPEPSSLVMMSSGLLAAAGAARRKFKA